MEPDDPQASELERAFLSLQCRTRAGVLRAGESAIELDDALEVWRNLIRMSSGQSAAIRRLATPSLRPELELEPAAGEVALPARIDWWQSASENRRVYRFLALQLAGRREFGTYADAELLARLRRGHDGPAPIEALFLLAEGVRIQQRIARAYPGSVRETEALAQALLERWRSVAQVDRLDYLLALALVPQPRAALPAWLPRGVAERVLAVLAPLRDAGASVEDSIRAAERLLFWAVSAGGESPTASTSTSTSLPLERMDSVASEGQAAAATSAGAEPAEPSADALEASSGGQLRDGSSGDAPPTSSAPPPPLGAAQRAYARLTARPGISAQTYVYDEWDHTLGAYRSRHCRVHELPARHDAGEFFDHTRRSQASLLHDVRRQFERIRPERYRPLRGLEDGEDLDLNALTDARIEARARRSPDNRVYTARVRQTRDVATLFLLDMSASTEQPYAEPGDPPVRRIIDTLKEALVVMATALSDLGDSYAIYGFSSQGHDRVEVYPVKTFDDPLSAAVKTRIGGITPKSGTRMGAALRHVIGKFSRVHASGKHLILLSDGYPQDQEYGPDRRSRTYGIEDTAVALREVSAAGITPFCITVDRAGHDYLREMCDPAQYMVIDELEQLPRELPKIYRRVVLG